MVPVRKEGKKPLNLPAIYLHQLGHGYRNSQSLRVQHLSLPQFVSTYPLHFCLQQVKEQNNLLANPLYLMTQIPWSELSQRAPILLIQQLPIANCVKNKQNILGTRLTRHQNILPIKKEE